jgi:hypothetical protein
LDTYMILEEDDNWDDRNAAEELGFQQDAKA